MEMKQQDQHAAEQLDIYINASQQGKQTQEEFPFVDQLFAMAKASRPDPHLEKR
jgi:hypothetical protein